MNRRDFVRLAAVLPFAGSAILSRQSRPERYTITGRYPDGEPFEMVLHADRLEAMTDQEIVDMLYDIFGGCTIQIYEGSPPIKRIA